jgi:hypothetical protein
MFSVTQPGLPLPSYPRAGPVAYKVHATPLPSLLLRLDDVERQECLHDLHAREVRMLVCYLDLS